MRVGWAGLGWERGLWWFLEGDCSYVVKGKGECVEMFEWKWDLL